MAIPDFQTLMLPLLQLSGDGKERSVRESVELLAKKYELTEQEIGELIPSGTQTLLYNRVGWARTYLSKSGLLELTHRPYYRITEQGKQVLGENLARIDMKFLEKFPEYIKFRDAKGTHKLKGNVKEQEERTPEENLEAAYQDIHETLAAEILESVITCSPSSFERMVVELLVSMGYGGSRNDAARAVGKANDGGIDGIIDEDRLGLDTIYIQAKKWINPVGRPEIQKFVGALAGKKAKKGIFISTSSFTNEAVNYALNVETRVILIDGKKLANLMIECNLGVTQINTFHIKRIDSDYFNNI